MRAVLAGTGGRLPVALGIAASVALLLIRPWVDQGLGRFLFWSVMASVVMITAVTIVRRLHAMGHTGAWVSLTAIPIVNLGFLVWLMVGARGGPTRPVALRHLAGLLLIAFLGAVVVSRAFWRPFFIVSEAMMPALLPGDNLIAVRGNSVERGAIVVYQDQTTGADTMLRVIGLPGDTVEMRAGALVLNGDPVPLEAAETLTIRKRQFRSDGVPNRCVSAPVGPDEACVFDRFIEALPGTDPYPILQYGPTPLDDFPSATVPDGHVYVLGDNRDVALDSRALSMTGRDGFIPISTVYARVTWVAFNLQNPGRVWQEVR